MGARIVGTLGPIDETLAGGTDDCSCSQGSDWCSISMECGQSACEFQDWGCGTMWIYGCDGDCSLQP
jgi:hypothetical protein